MTPEAILSFLKFGGPIVGLLSAIWSTTQKITYEGADGAKRLTLQGRVLIGIIVLSTLISILALGFETVIERQTASRKATEKKEADDEKRANDRMLAEEKQQARDDAAAREQATVLARLEADSVEQKRFLEQGLLISGKAAEQQRRDARISLQVTKEANARLGDAQRMFAQFELINYPLSKLEAGVGVSLNLEGQDLTELWKVLEERTDLPSVRKRRYEPQYRTVSFTPKDLQIGGRAMKFINYATTGADVRLNFVVPDGAGRQSGKSATDGIGRSDGSGGNGKTVISVDLGVKTIRAELPERTLTVEYYGGPFQIEKLRYKGEKLSLADVKRFVPILSIRRGGAFTLGKRPPDTLRSVSVSLNGLQWFSASAQFGIEGPSSFVLQPSSGR